ncbi:kielin/chordin-like protein [Pygocentrus nattereri]|uniref:kielin/chordin-like protein n=1 Tax=Pygocentrus nattereri TaxID=42514 RepID=UPI000814A5F7|nr:kielin/chordin-like protein [Pygocentrus nattereri]
MEFAVSQALFFAQLTLLALCSSLQTKADAQLQDNDENVIDLLEALNITRFVRGITKTKGREPGALAWRFRSRAPHLTLPQDFSRYLLSSSRGSLGLHLVGQQARDSEATLISLSSRAALQLDSPPLLRLSSSTRDDWLRLEFQSQEVLKSEVLTLPGGNPFSGGGWVRMGLGLEPRRLVLFVECKEATVLDLDQTLNLELPFDLQVTFSSTAGDKASKFTGYWQTAELYTRAYEKRPWLCESETEGAVAPPVDLTSLLPDLGVVHDQPERVAGTGLGPPGTLRGRVAPSDLAQDYTSLEEALHSVNTMLTMLKAQNEDLQTRVQYLESCECVRRTCTWEGREKEEGSRWLIDSHTVCSCTSGKVHCVVSNECSYEGRIYRNDEVFSPHPCSKCVCQNGKVECDEVRCPALSCKTYIPHGACCPVCQPGCEYEGELYADGEVFVSRTNPCLNCSCSNHLVRCNPTHCPPTLCASPYKRAGECCPTCSACELDGRPHSGSFSTIDGCQVCTCRNGDVSCVDKQQCPVLCHDGVRPPFGSCCKDCTRCEYQGEIILEGVSFSDRHDPCKRCICSEGNVVCSTTACPTLDCTLLETVGGECCPRCRSCMHQGNRHQHNSRWHHPDDPCSVCTCLEGHVQCDREECKLPCTNPPSPLPGSCCPVCDGCGMNGVNFRNGERVPSGDRCEQCVCVNGNVQCEHLPCPATICSHPVRRAGDCCPRCEQCNYESEQYSHGQSFTSKQNPCLNCHCSAGEVVCENTESSCPPLHCAHPARRHGECCPTCDMCEYERRVYADGKEFNPLGDGPCLKCTCERGNVRCHQERCPRVHCANPIRDPHVCCPSCKACVLDDVEYDDGSVWDADGSPCNTCSCKEGTVVCQTKACASTSCLHPNTEPGECCASCYHCLYKQRIYENGQTFSDPDDSCQRCTCQDGSVRCAVAQCPSVSCSNPYTPPGQCCPQCPDCVFENQVFVNGETFPSPVNPCEDCVCTGGHVNCRQQCQRPSCNYPVSGTCCQNNCNGCSYAGKEYANGMHFPHPTDKCRECHCINGNVQCLMKRCPSLQCSNRISTPGQCCPQCPAPPADCVYEGHSYRHMQQFYHPSDSCQSCSCTDGKVSCHRKPCPLALCTHPIFEQCCRTCDGCMYNGEEHSNGAVFVDAYDPCGTCVCREGSVTCERRQCPAINCPFPVQGKCCQSCEGCRYAGVEYLNGQEFPDPADRCNHCVCMSGHVTCSKKPCYNPGCTHPALLSGHCCPVCDGCFYNGVMLLSGQTIPDRNDHCSECTCRAGSVHCVRRACEAPKCPHPVSGPCSCPVCKDCLFQGKVHADGEIFQAPNAVCEECRCTKGEVRCTPKSCPQVACPNPAQDQCGCGVCNDCRFHGRECGNGERFPDPQDHCQHCSCQNGGVSCAPVSCPVVSCRRPVRPAGECCPVCTGVCEYFGQEYESGSTFTPPTDRCLSCTCLNEIVSCQRKPCAQQCSHPARSTDCCPVCDLCLYEGVEYKHTQTFTSRSNPCQRCVCMSGTVACTAVACPAVSCPNPVTLPGQCCPQCRPCVQNGIEYKEGQRWNSPSDPCTQCTCMAAEVSCAGLHCAPLSCMHQVTDPSSCCSRCRGCVYDGVEHAEGSTWFASSGPCMSCMCVDGVTTCSEIQCLSPCQNQISVPGECCPLCADCIYDGRVYGPGENFHPSNDPCQICTCEVMPDGQQHLRCYRKQCPSLVDCPKHNILFSGPDSCCPVCAQPLSNCTETLIGNEVLATDDPCFTCQCKDLTWTCIHQTCYPLSCPPDEQYTPPDSCCPICNVCVLEGERRRVSNGESWTDSEDECITCSCNLGHVECNIKVCAPPVCQDGPAKVKSPGKCCYECQDLNVQCVYEGQTYDSNEYWEMDECTTCTCVSGDVHCQTERCPAVSCTSDESPSLIPGMCCPHCIPRPATCIVFGDPHYRTFDGKMVNFQGACTYVLAQDCEGGDFSIHVTNDDRGRNGVSWTKEVTVFIGDVVVQLLQDWVVKVDYQTVSLPFLKEPYVYLERKTNTILLNTNIGMKVLWSGRSHLEVSVPGTYKKHMCGLCGNFNNYPQDDMRLRNGQISSSEAAFGNDWKVGSGNHSRGQCSDGRDIDPCKEAGYFARKTANSRCAVLKSAVFQRCHKVIPPEMFFASCVYDLCACGSNTDECLCDALEAYASECREAGVVLQWRSPSLCAVGCPLDRGYVFDECGPPCPKTCFNKDVPLGVIEAHCFKPCVPGCQCPAGLVQHEAHCIAPEKCPKIIYSNP